MWTAVKTFLSMFLSFLSFSVPSTEKQTKPQQNKPFIQFQYMEVVSPQK